ncbi:MAG: papain-like cysteine protease family protein [Bacteroidia bacterium]
MSTSITLFSNSRVLFNNKKELDYACRHFELVEGKIKTVRLKLNSPGHGTADHCCWESVAKTISDFYNHELPEERKTEKIKNCGLENMDVFDCGRFNSLDKAVRLDDASGKQMSVYLSQTHIMKEINRKKPVCVCLKWDSTNAVHSIIIYGYSMTPDSFILHIADPWDGDHDVDYADFSYLYRANWPTTYLTA